MSRPVLRTGSRGHDVRTLQSRLSLIPDGIFGPVTEDAVKAFQRSQSLQPDGIGGPETWDALGISAAPAPRQIDEIILHCTATPEGRDCSVDEIRAWHMQGRGFADIGYHFLIRLDGSVCPGRHVARVGAHCLGHNARSIGIAYAGGCEADGVTPKDTRTPRQKAAMRDLVDALLRQYPGATVHCHNEFANKACPSFTIDQL